MKSKHETIENINIMHTNPRACLIVDMDFISDIISVLKK